MANVSKSAPACQVPDIIPAYLPGGGISILAGAPNLGKTAFLSTFLRDLQAGRLIFGRQPRETPIGYINADRSWEKGAGLWLARAGVTSLPYYSMRDDPGFNPKQLRKRFDRTDMLASFIDRLKLPEYSLIVVDPVSPFLGGNLLDYDTCLVACHEIGAYLRSRKYTLLGTAHTSKMKVDKRERYLRTSDQILGSTAIPGFTDAVLHLASPEELGKTYYQLTWHPHGAVVERYYLDRDEQGLFVPWEGADTGTLARVLALFPDPPATIAFAALVEYAQALPLTKKTVQRTLDRLLDNGSIERVKHGHYQKVTIN